MKREESVYFQLKENATKYQYIHHFTKKETLGEIIQGQSLLLHRLDKVVDKSENEFLPYLWKSKVFVVCFTHSPEGKERFWKEYAQAEGIRLSFPNWLMTEENYRIVSCSGYIFPRRINTNLKYHEYARDIDWAYYDVSKLDMLYIDPRDAREWNGEGNALIKNCVAEDSYNWEEETRIRVAMDPIGPENQLNAEKRYEIVVPSFDSIYLELGKEVLQNMYVSVREGTRIETIKEIRKKLKTCTHTKNCKIFYLTPKGEIHDTFL